MLYGILGFFMQTEMCWGHGLKIAVDFNQALIEKLARMLAEENSKEGVKKRRSKYLRAIPSSKPLKPNPRLAMERNLSSRNVIKKFASF